VDWLIGVVIVALLGAAMGGLALMAKHVRRRGAAGQAIAAAMAAYDEGFHTTAHSAFVEMRAQDERPLQATRRGKRRG